MLCKLSVFVFTELLNKEKNVDKRVLKQYEIIEQYYILYECMVMLTCLIITSSEKEERLTTNERT